MDIKVNYPYIAGLTIQLNKQAILLEASIASSL